MSTTVDKLVKWFADLRSESAQLKAKLTQLQDERAQMLSAPPCEADMIATFDAYISCTERFFEAQVERIATGFLSERPFWRPDHENAEPRKGRFGDLPILNRAGKPYAMSLLVAGAMAGPMRETIKAAVSKLDLPTGPTLAERRKRIGQLDKEIATIESDLEKIKEQAARVAQESRQ